MVTLLHLMMIFDVCSDISVMMITAQLATRVRQRLYSAFRPGTRKSQKRIFNDFLGFMVATGLCGDAYVTG